MQKYLIFILLAVFNQSFGQSGYDAKIYYESGKIQVERKFDKSCKCFHQTEYFESGKVRSKKTFLTNGPSVQIDGEDIIYFEDGKIQMYYFWKEGSPSGRIYCNYADGKLAYENFYSNKYKTGTWKFYHQDGSLKEELVFVDNKTLWDKDNNDATQKFYFHGKLAYTVNLVGGKETSLKIVDPVYYNKLQASEIPTGQKLFSDECAVCHNPNIDLIGPKLKGVSDKRSTDWLIKMITNGDALRNSGDIVAILLYENWSNINHPNYEHLSNNEVKLIIDYLKTLK